MTIKTTDNPHQLLATLRDIEQRPSSHTTQDRRYVRCSLRGEAILQTVENAANQPRAVRVQLRNISLTGVGFLISEPLEPGSLWRVTFVDRHFAVGHQTISIRHCRPVTEGTFVCGGQFCIEPGLLHVMGVDPALTDGTPDEFFDGEAFLPPGDAC
jgi:hypothetical protein